MQVLGTLALPHWLIAAALVEAHLAAYHANGDCSDYEG